jgi:hypothetical protein
MYTAENEINLNPYYQAAVNRQPKNDNTLMNNYFRFSLERVPFVSYFCQRATIPSLGFNFIEVPTRFGAKLNITGTSFEFDDLTISFIVDEKMQNWLEIYNWMKQLANLEKSTETVDYKERTSDAEIITLNSASKPQLAFKFKHIFPVSLGAVNFDSTLTDTEPIVVDATFKYTTYEVNNIDGPTR